MKKITSALFVVLFGFPILAQVPNYVPTNGLVGWWPFNGNAIDESVNTNDGTVNGATLTTDRFSMSNSAYSFNGSTSNSDFIQCINPIANQSAFSISYWINRFDISTTRWHIMLQSAGSTSFELFSVIDTIYFRNFGSGTANFDIKHKVTISNNNFFHVCVTSNNNITKMFVNGILCQTNNTPILLVGSGSLHFGKHANFLPTAGFSFNGKLDDIGIWNRALTTCEIQDLYNAQVNSATANAGTDFTKSCMENVNGTQIGAAPVAGVTYSWSPTAGLSSSTIANPIANPTTTTAYTLTTTSGGCTATDEVVVTVNNTPPVANAGNDFTRTCTQNLSGAQIGAASLAGVTYAWSPAMGLSSTSVSNPTASPSATTTYTLTATNTTNGCTATDQVTVTVDLTVPVAAAGNDFTKTCVSNVNGSQIGSTSLAGVTYSWSPAAGLSSTTTANPTANPSANTTYTVTATNTSSGCTATDQVFVTVNNTLPTVNGGADQTVCSGSAVTLFGSGANTYSWNNGVSNGVAFTPLSTGTYIVTGTNTATGCTNTDQVVVNVNPLPNVSQPIDQVVCCQELLSPIMFVSSFPGTSFSWQAQPNPNVSGYPLSGNGMIPSMILTNSALNTQSVTFIVTPSLNGCTGSPVSFSIYVLPCSVFVVQPSSQTACAGSSLNPVLFSGNYTSVDWVNTNSQTGLPITGSGDIAQVTLTNNTPNTITSSITVVPTYTDSLFLGASCQGPPQSFTISVLPLPIVSAGPDQTLCVGDSVLLSGSGAATYQWDQNVQDSVAFSPQNTQSYSVTGTDANGCTGLDTVMVTVNNTSFTTLNESTLDSYTLNGQTYTQSGTYTQVLTNAAGCDSTITLNLNLSFTGLENVEGTESIRVYPNPTNDVLVVEGYTKENEVFSLLDASGRTVLGGTLNGSKTEVSLRHLNTGMYMLQVGGDAKPIRVVKE